MDCHYDISINPYEITGINISKMFREWSWLWRSSIAKRLLWHQSKFTKVWMAQTCSTSSSAHGILSKRSVSYKIILQYLLILQYYLESIDNWNTVLWHIESHEITTIKDIYYKKKYLFFIRLKNRLS